MVKSHLHGRTGESRKHPASSSPLWIPSNSSWSSNSSSSHNPSPLLLSHSHPHLHLPSSPSNAHLLILLHSPHPSLRYLLPNLLPQLSGGFPRAQPKPLPISISALPHPPSPHLAPWLQGDHSSHLRRFNIGWKCRNKICEFSVS